MNKSKVYTANEVKELFSEFVDSHLGNCIEESVLGRKEKSMPSQYRESYTIVKENGEKERIRLYGRNKEETDLKFQAICRGSDKSKWKSDMTFMTFVQQEYKPNHMVSPFIAETTQGKYEYNLKRYIYPFFGTMPISGITVNDIQKFRKKMAEASEHGYAKNLTSKSIEDMTGFLNKIFKVAEAMSIIEENPVKRPLLKKVGEEVKHHKALDPYTMDRCKKMIPKIKDERVRLYAALLFYNGGGMRPEEILGLRWENVDFENGYADVTQAVTYAGANRHVVIKAPKTSNSIRCVILPKVLIDILAACRKDSGFIIHGRDLQKPIPYSGWQRTYIKMQHELDIKGQYCNYDLRTTYATEMIEDGCSSAMTAKLMGHKDSRMVETVYSQTRRQGIEKMRESIEMKNALYGS